MADDTVYGFNGQDANELIDGLGGRERTVPNQIPQSARLKLVLFTLEEDIDATSHLAGATINSNGPDDGESIEVTDWTEAGGKSGDKGVAWKTKDPTTGDEIYAIIEIKSQPGSSVVRFTLDEDIDPVSHLAGASIVSDGDDDGTSIEVEDWALNGGKSGDKGLALLVGSVYYIIEIYHQPQIVRFTLTEDLAIDRDAEATADIEGLIVGSPTSGTVINWGKRKGKIGDRGMAWRVSTGDEVSYFVIELEKSCTRLRGRVAETFDCSASTVVLDSLYPMDGQAPDDEVVAVNFGMAAAEGAIARAEYNENLDQWELYWVQIDPVTSVYIESNELKYDTACLAGQSVVELTECP